jgi:chemotaxis protein methyltransferase CheR
MSRPGPTLASGPLADIAAAVRTASGLVIDASRRDVLVTLVQDRLTVLGLADADAYCERIGGDPAELQTLIEGLTIGETYFARIPPQIRALQELVLPALLARGDRRIRIWSAGCSTGEEVYTLALLLAKLLPPDAAGWDVRVIGTDINSRALAIAREGRFGTRSVSLLPDEDLERFFIRDGNGWRVGAELRRFVDFRQHNLATDPPPAQRLDLILCRNVLIYFDRPQMLGVIDGMYRALAPGGWLLLGHSETLWRLYDGFELVRHGDAFLYRRQPELRPVVRRPPPLRQPIPVPIPPRIPDAREEIREALSAGAYPMAADLAAAHLEHEPLAAEVHYLHGLALVEIGDDAPALVALRRAAYLDPSSGFAQFLLGVVLGRLGHGAEAARAYGAAALALSQRGSDERARELGGRRVDDLAAMCRQLARAPQALSHPMSEVIST